MFKGLARSLRGASTRPAVLSSVSITTCGSRCYSSSSSSSSSSPSPKIPRSSRSLRGRRNVRKAAKTDAGAEAKLPEGAVAKAPSTRHTSILSLAYDSFFSGYRPLYINKSSTSVFDEDEASYLRFQPFTELAAGMDPSEDALNSEMDAFAYPLGTTSASGLLLDPVMKNLPQSGLDRIRNNRAPPPPGVAPSRESAVSDAAMKLIEMKFSRGYQGDEHGDVLSTADIFSTVRCFAMMDDLESLQQLQKRLDQRGDSTVRVIVATIDSNGNLEVRDPLVPRRGRIHATSVVRKRKLKIKKHKLRKRRRAERAQRRRLGV